MQMTIKGAPKKKEWRQMGISYKSSLILFTAIAIMLLVAGCGGGSGGSDTTPAVDEAASIALSSNPSGRADHQQVITYYITARTTSGGAVSCRIASWGDNSTPSGWSQNCQDGKVFTHFYENTTTGDIIRQVKVEANNTIKTSSTTQDITISPAGSNQPGQTAPTLTSFSCTPGTVILDQSFKCEAQGTCPTGQTCTTVVDYGNGNTGSYPFGSQNITGSYAVIPYDDVSYTVKAFTVAGGNNLTSATKETTVRVRRVASDAPEAPKLSSTHTQVGEDPNRFAITGICNDATCTVKGTAATNYNKMYVLTAAGQESEITLNKSNWTWEHRITVDNGKQEKMVLVYWGENSETTESTKITVEVPVDRKAPNVPAINPVTSPTNVASQQICGTKDKNAQIIRGTTAIAGINDTFDSTTTEQWCETVNFTSQTTYSYTYFSQDEAGNKSANITVQIQYTSDTGGGGGNGGGGTTNPDAPTISCSSSVNGLTLTATCSISGSGCTSASMNWGDGSSDSTISCSGSTIGHTYSSSSSETYTATVNSSNGSNTYSRTINLSSGGGTNYARIGSCAIANSVSITSNGVDTIYALLSSGQVRSYDTNCGSETVMNFVNRPEGFANARDIAYSTGNDRIGIADRGGNKVFIFDVSGNDLIWNRTIGDDTVFDEPDRLAFDSVGYLYLIDRGNHALKRFNAAGVQQCAYTSWSMAATGMGIAVDNSGNVYTTSQSADSVEKFNSSCSKITSMATGVNTDTPVLDPVQLAVIPAGGELWIGDDGHGRIVVINPTTKTDLGIVAPSGNPIAMSIINGDLYALIGGTTIEHFGSQ